MNIDLTSYLPSVWMRFPELIFDDQISADKRSVSNLRKDIGFIVEGYIQNKSIFLAGLHEIVMNIAQHSLNFSFDEKIYINLFKETSKSHKNIVTIIHDNGKAFDPNMGKAKSPKDQFEKGAQGGYGMFMYKRVFNKMNYKIIENGNVLSLFYKGDSKIF